MIWYIQMRIPQMKSRLLVPALQVLLLLWACLCSMSRITDHRHHWWDVLCGAIIGIGFASLTVSCIYIFKLQAFVIKCTFVFVFSAYFYVKTLNARHSDKIRW